MVNLWKVYFVCNAALFDQVDASQALIINTSLTWQGQREPIVLTYSLH